MPPSPPFRLPALSDNLKGAVCVVVGGFLLIVMASLVKFLGQKLPPFEVLFVRFFAGFLALMPVLWRVGFRVLRTDRFGLHFMRGFWGFMGNLCFFFALVNMANIGDTVTIQFSRPLIVAVAAGMFLGEIVGVRRWAVTAIGFLGVLVITRPFGSGFEPFALVAMCGALFSTMVVLTVKKLSRTESTLVIMFYFALFTTVFSAIPAIIWWETPSWELLGLLVLTGVLGIVGQSLFTHGVGLGETSFVLPLDYLRIVYSFLMGIILFAEIPDAWSLTGAAVIIGASLYLVKTDRGAAAK